MDEGEALFFVRADDVLDFGEGGFEGADVAVVELGCVEISTCHDLSFLEAAWHNKHLV